MTSSRGRAHQAVGVHAVRSRAPSLGWVVCSRGHRVDVKITELFGSSRFQHVLRRSRFSHDVCASTARPRRRDRRAPLPSDERHHVGAKPARGDLLSSVARGGRCDEVPRRSHARGDRAPCAAAMSPTSMMRPPSARQPTSSPRSRRRRDGPLDRQARARRRELAPLRHQPSSAPGPARYSGRQLRRCDDARARPARAAPGGAPPIHGVHEHVSTAPSRPA